MRVAAAWSVAFLLLQAGAAFAQEADDDAMQRAIVLFEESETLYNQGEFAQAAAMLRRAYALHPDPTLLFNLARALEGAGDLDGAIDAYERYLEDNDEAEDAGAIRARVETLRDQRDRLAAAGDDQAPATDDGSDHGEPGARAEPGDGGGGDALDVVPWILAGVGIAAVGVGVAMGVLAQDYGAQAQEEPTMRRAVELQDEGETYALIANVMFIAGGVVAGAGLVWGVITLADGGSDEASATLHLTPNGARVRGRF